MTALFSFLKNARLWTLFIALILSALCGILFVLAPQQGPLLLYKVVLVVLAAVTMRLYDLVLFWYAQPSGYLKHDWRDDIDADVTGGADYSVVGGYETLFIVAQIRQAALISVGILAVALGL